jgi:hypothetical protein
MTDQSIPRVGTKAKCRHCGEEIIFESWFRDGRGPNPPIWAHSEGPRTCGTRPKGWRRDSWPFADPEPAAADSHVCGNCEGVDPDTCLANPNRLAAAADRRARYAKAIHRYDYEHGLSGNDIPSKHHLGEADAVLAVRDPELEQLRAEVERLKGLVAESEAPGHAIRRAAVLNRVQTWADGPCPTRPKGFEIIGDRALGYVQAMDEIAQLIAGHGPLALNPQEQP